MLNRTNVNSFGGDDQARDADEVRRATRSTNGPIIAAEQDEKYWIIILPLDDTRIP
jgi:hypothetical protein